MAVEKEKEKREVKKTSFDDLPEHIIQHILSFLPEKYAIKTRILSKAWLSAWRSRPILDFNFHLFFDKLKLYKIGSEEEVERHKKFSKYVKRTLERYSQQKMGIEKLKLDARISGKYSPEESILVERCTRVAVERGVKNLHLFGKRCDELPQIIVGAKSLEDLFLVEFKMLHLSNEKIMWHSLKRLCLYAVYLDEAMFENIISSCPLLEILEITYCSDNVDYKFNTDQLQFKVNEHYNLKKLTVRIHASQKLILEEAPKLESLVCTNYDNYLLDGDWIPCGFSLHSSQYQNLKMLHLCAVGITDDFFNNLEQKFPHLQDLSVLYGKDLRRIKISSPTLQRIQLMENCKLEEAHFDVPSIELLEYACAKCDEIILPEFSFAATKGHWISKLRINWKGNVDGSWFLKLKKILVSLIRSKIFLKIAIYGNIELDMNEIRNSVTFLEPQQELSLSFSLSSKFSALLSTLDGIFCICRPNSISLLWIDGYENNPVMKLLYDMLMLRTNQDEQYHKLQQQIKCWQHDLRQATVEIISNFGIRMAIARNDFEYSKKELADQQPEALDWDSILKALTANGAKHRMIYFILNWKKT